MRSSLITESGGKETNLIVTLGGKETNLIVTYAHQKRKVNQKQTSRGPRGHHCGERVEFKTIDTKDWSQTSQEIKRKKMLRQM